MSTVRRLAKGYPVEILQGIESTIIIKFLCSICKLVLRNPVQRYCGHRYCKECIEDLNASATDARACPSCVAEGIEHEEDEDESLQQLFPDNAIKREMAKLTVHCCYTGCDWTGTFKDFAEHFEQHPSNQENLCPFGCGAKLQADASTDEHILSRIAEHFEIIMNRLRTLEGHVGAATGASASPTPLFVRINELQTKIESLRLDSTSVSSSRPADRGASQFQLPPTLLSKPADLQTILTATDEKLQIIEGVITVLNREIEKLTLDTEAADRQRRLERELVDTLEKKVKTLERLMTIKDATITELTVKVTALEVTSFDGTLVWRITEVSRKRQEAISGRATSIYSPPFYTSRTGYKMCLRAYLNGDGMGKGTHLSVFFVVMRGNYDALLRWPFRQKVTLMLLNQSQRDNIIDAFRPDPTSSSFKRPTSDMNIASGCPVFAGVDILDPSSSAGFVKDDQLFLKVLVDCSDLP
jgi:TNF receptor-associated factor 2